MKGDTKMTNDYVRFWPFFKAIQEKDWKSVVEIVRSEHEKNQVLTSKFIFSTYEETIFHVISRNLNVPVSVFEKFASIEPKSLELDDQYGQSPLFAAALAGNIKAAKFFVLMNKDMPNKRKAARGLLPIQSAAKWGHKEIIHFLWKHTTVSLDGKDDKKNNRGFKMLKNLINCDHYDIAFELLKKYPNLARGEKKDRGSILEMLASRPSAFKSGSQLGYWESKIYEWIPVPEETIPPHKESVHADVENQNSMVDMTNTFSKKRPSFNKLCIMLWKPLMLVPGIKSLHYIKLTHMHTLEIVKAMCHDVVWSYEEALESLWKPLNSATRLGICELANEILKTNYFSFALHNKEKTEDILRLAILHHQDKVFHLITEMKIFHWAWKIAPERKEGKERRKTDRREDADATEGKLGQHADAEATKGKIDQHAHAHAPKGKNDQHANRNDAKAKTDQHGEEKLSTADNLLHLAADYVPSNQVSGAALQMQRELQFFKAVQSFLHPSLHEQRNGHNQTPAELFTEKHKKLVEEGEKWMKDTATSCSVVAALIITVVFAAAFTVPGGNNSEGFPLFLHEPPFIIFIISDALAFFSSAASVFTFLGILTSRYSEEDFLESLPGKLISGLFTLFFSIASMMTAFCAAIYILLSDLRSAVFTPIALLGGLTVIIFVRHQLPLIIEMYSSTYRSILYPPRN